MQDHGSEVENVTSVETEDTLLCRSSSYMYDPQGLGAEESRAKSGLRNHSVTTQIGSPDCQVLFAILFYSAAIYYLAWLKYWDKVTYENRCYQTGDASSTLSEGTPE